MCHDLNVHDKLVKHNLPILVSYLSWSYSSHALRNKNKIDVNTRKKNCCSPITPILL